ncbi:hypothetical protein Tco_1463812, partial [Tanacetum coccineum]
MLYGSGFIVNTNVVLKKIPQVFLVDYYFENLCCVDSDEEVTLMYKSNEKEKKDVSTMSLEELIAWEQEETQSPSYLRSSHVWKKTSASTSKGKVLLDDFEDVANGKAKESITWKFIYQPLTPRVSVNWDFLFRQRMSSIDTYSTTKDLVFDEWVASYKSDEMVIEVFFRSCFFFCPLDYPGGQILDLRLPRSTRMSYKEMIDLLLDKTKDDIWKWFYCKPKCKLENGLTLVENDRDHKKMFELANFHG